jgi:hypothetical protein
MEIDAAPEAQDRILLDRVAPLRETQPVSFLRANKPEWRILVEAYMPPLSPDQEDAVADSEAAFRIIRLDLDGVLGRGRREIVLASFVWALAHSGASGEERRQIHLAGYRWAVDGGRWDPAAVQALQTRFARDESALAGFVEAASRGDESAFGGPEAARVLFERWRGRVDIANLREALDRHANRLGVFAEPVAILHYFLWRLTA